MSNQVDQIPKVWKTHNVNDFILVNKNSVDKNYEYEEIVYLDTGSVTRGEIDQLQLYSLLDAPSRAKRLVEERDIVYSTVRPNQEHYGYIKNPPENLVVSTGFAVITTDESKLNSKYFYYYLTQDQLTNFLHQIAEQRTSAYPSIKPEDISNLEIMLPPIDYQLSVVSILSSFDDKIELLRQQNETLEKIAQTIFDEWFVDNPNNDWIKKPLDEIAEFLNGVACQKYPAKPKENKLPVLKIKELNTGITENSDWCSLDVDTKYHVEHGDVIFSWSGTLMIKIWDGEKCVLNQHLFKVSSDIYPKWFYLYWSKHHLDKFIGIAKSKATTMGHIKRSDLSNSLVCVPTDEELKKFDEIMSKILTKKIENMKTISILNNTRDVLLPKLMTGKIRIDADKQ